MIAREDDILVPGSVPVPGVAGEGAREWDGPWGRGLGFGALAYPADRRRVEEIR
jgi:hypothetical protein